MISTILFILLIPIMLSAVLAVCYGVFISWVLLFAFCGNKWCRDLWGSL